MPLITGKSPSSFSKNVSTEMNAGKPLKQSLAIAYAMKKKAQDMAKGGMPCAAHGMQMCKMCHGGKMAEGGYIEEEESSGYRPMPKEHERMNEPAVKEDALDLNQHGEWEEGPQGRREDDQHFGEREVYHKEENQEFPEAEDDLVSRIMKQREQSFARGGHVKRMAEGGEPDFDRLRDSTDRHLLADETGEHADMEMNQFDDMVKDDRLGDKADYTGSNSGDEIGDEQEDEDRDDIVSRIMRARRLKDRNPR